MNKISQEINIIAAVFLRRLNRFVVECRVQEDIVLAHLPNPGRMWELLFPGCRLFVTPTNGEGKRTCFKVMGVERDGIPIMLDTHFSNTVAARLIEQRKVPGWEDWQLLRREVPFGSSRFDLLLGRGEERMVVEVKSCTLFGNRTAMFPDAITERGRKHLIELAELTHQGYQAGVLFLLQWPRAKWFLPDYHTDLAFARTFYQLRGRLDSKALALEWHFDFTLGEEIREAIIPWDLIGREVQDGGNYIVVLRVDSDTTVAVGSKGDIFFPRGYYLYVGSAKHNLTKRLERHSRKRKKFHWHIDYLRDAAAFHAGIAVRTTAALEHDIAQAVSAIADWQIDGFGASDCACATHLFGMHGDPVHTPAFIEVVQKYRMDRLEKELQSGCR